jgi:hypothetical protein
MGLELGLGLGLNKGGYRGDAYNDLVKLSTWFIDPNQPQGVNGTADAFNTAKVNPLQDRAGVVGKNLADPTMYITGYTDATGKFLTSPNTTRSVVIPCEVGKVYSGSANGNRNDFGFTSEFPVNNTTLLTGRISPPTNATAPPNAKFLIYYTNNDNGLIPTQTMVNEGSTPLPFEPYGKANVLMQNVAWTNLDGYRVETINGKTNVFFNLDGVDTFGAVNSASAPNPTGSDDFWVLCVFRPDDVGVRYYGLVRSNFISVATIQYGVLQAGDAKIKCFVDNNAYDAAPSTTTLSYILYGKFNNVGSIIYNGVEVASIPNTPLLTSRPHTQLSCRSNSTDGLTKSAYGKGLQGICAMQVAPQGTIDKAKVVSTVAKAMKQIYGLGV